MAVVFDAAASAIDVAGPSSLTYSHTVAAGSDLAIFVIPIWRSSVARTVSGVTYNGVALTNVASSLSEGLEGFGGRFGVSIYRLVAPATGANNVVITMSGVIDYIIGGSASFSGVDQTTPAGTAATATGVSSTPSVTITSAVDDIAIAGTMGYANSAAEFSCADTELFERYDSGTAFMGAGGRIAGAASVTINWTGLAGFGETWRASGVSVKASAGGGGATTKRYTLTTLGVG